MGAIIILITGLLAVWLLRLAVKFHTYRRTYAKLPGPPHSYVFGHLKVVGEVMKELPPNIHLNVALMYISQKYQLKEAWYLDMWPAAPPFLVIASADLAQQVTVANVLPKHPANKQFLGDMTGDKAVITLEGQEWKDVRSVLMPAYAPSYVLSLLPMMLQDLSIMCDRLQDAADKDDTIKLQHYLTDMTIDIIGHAVLDVDFNAQTAPHPMAVAFRRMVVLSATGLADPLAKLKYGLQLSRVTRRITSEIKNAIKTRWDQGNFAEKETSRLTIDLILSAIRDGHSVFSNPTRSLDQVNLNLATDQVKTLLLGGHDTSAATLSYVVCLLSQHPEILSRLRAEHSHLVDPTKTRDETIRDLTASPSLLTNLPYTMAVIKETMRLYPTSATARVLSPTSAIQTITTSHNPGASLPLSIPGTELNIYIAAYMVHHNADHFSDPYSFIPDRFLPDSEYAKAHPFPSYAWRPFEKGPRACIGIEFALVEMKLALVMLMREFDFEPRYPKDARRAPQSVGGEVFYQTMEFAAKPIGGMPVGVKRRMVNAGTTK